MKTIIAAWTIALGLSQPPDLVVVEKKASSVGFYSRGDRGGAHSA